MQPNIQHQTWVDLVHQKMEYSHFYRDRHHNHIHRLFHRREKMIHYRNDVRIYTIYLDHHRSNLVFHFDDELNPPMSDVEYLAAFRSVVMPILEEFHPQIILVSCGFDGAIGHPHPLGGYQLTPTCFGYMTKKLMSLADGKVVLVLEGGYELSSLAECGKLCVEALLSKELPTFNLETLKAKPNQNAITTLKEVIHVQKKYWRLLKRYEHLVSLSHDKAISSYSDDSS